MVSMSACHVQTNRAREIGVRFSVREVFYIKFNPFLFNQKSKIQEQNNAELSKLKHMHPGVHLGFGVDACGH